MLVYVLPDWCLNWVSISLQQFIWVEHLLFKSIEKWWIVILSVVVNFVFVSYKNDFEIRMHFASDTVGANSDSAVVMLSHAHIVHIEQIVQTLVQLLQAIQNHDYSLLHTSHYVT